LLIQLFFAFTKSANVETSCRVNTQPFFHTLLSFEIELFGLI
jgi:hypothetical protein